MGHGRSVVVVALTAALAACSSPPPVEQPPTPPVTEADARALLEQIEAVVASGELSNFCAEFAADTTMCADSMEAVGSEGPLPAGPAEIVDTRPTDDGSLVVGLAGTLDSGVAYDSDIEIVRTDGDLAAVNPVYWEHRELVIGPGGDATVTVTGDPTGPTDSSPPTSGTTTGS